MGAGTADFSILALDLGTATAAAKWHDRVVSCHRWTSKADLGLFLNSYRVWLCEQVNPFGPDGVVVYELPWVGAKTHQRTALKLMSLAGVTAMVCDEMGLRVYSANTRAALLHFTGNGGGKRAEKKERTMRACRERGLNPDTQDEADAIMVLDYAAHCFGVRAGIPEGPLFGRLRGEVA